MTPEEQEEILKDVGISLARNTSQAWKEITLPVSAVHGHGSFESEAIYEDKTREKLNVPNEVMFNIWKLREGMHQENAGAWFSAKYEIKRPGSFNVEYNYDTEPSFSTPAPASEYAQDLYHFPRSEEATPS